MQFNSFIFIIILLPLSVVLYHLLNKLSFTLGKLVLLASSIVFYAYGDLKPFLVLCISLVINYGFSLLLFRTKKYRKLFLLLPVIINIGLLLYFKYLNFAITNINSVFAANLPLKELILPLGISFFTFQQIAYLVALGNGELKNNNPLNYLIYILYFPKILMGPLTDPVDFINQLNDAALKKLNWDNILSGIKIFSLGLFKKVLIADVFGAAVNWGFLNTEAATSLDWLLIMLFYTLEIYFDFSGYSDMATGASIMLNITLPINFDSPYKALSIRDFWKRWHISLTKFFTKYVYIPLGGNKKGPALACVNTMIVFLISGLWHGANWTFLLWGALHGIFSIIDRLFEKQEQKIFSPIRWFLTFAAVNFLWLLFRSASISEWWEIVKKIFSFQDFHVSGGLLKTFTSPVSELFPKAPGWLWMALTAAFSMVLCLCFENNYRNLHKKSRLMTVLSAVGFVLSFICLSSESVFVYFNF